MLVDTGPALCVLGVGPRCGKSVVSSAILRLHADAGCRVAPFKAAVVTSGEDCDAAMTITRHGMAARTPLDARMCPISIVTDVPRSGEAFIGTRSLGTIRLLNDDTPVWTSLREKDLRVAIDTVSDALRDLVHDFDGIVAEGAGAIGELPVDADLSNLFLARQLAAPIVLTARQSSGGSAIAVRGAATYVRRTLGRAVTGYVLTDVSEPELSTVVGQQVDGHRPTTLFGIIPHYSFWEQPSERLPTDDELIELWAEALRPMQNLLLPSRCTA